jgi:phenylacetate-coenzyme A ligase PaaK-like adenylate-forming protein
VGVISYRRRAPLTDVEVDSLLFTTLLEHAAYVLINVEMDDCGIIEDAACDCTYSAMGFGRRIRDIASYGKLTGIGVTLVGTDVIRVLEEVLPARFGGCATDYQLVEQDDEVQARLELRVSRRLKPASLDEVKDCFLRELRQFEGGAGASRIWRDTGAIQVVHENPIMTQRGKVLALHLMGSGTGRQK